MTYILLTHLGKLVAFSTQQKCTIKTKFRYKELKGKKKHFVIKINSFRSINIWNEYIKKMPLKHSSLYKLMIGVGVLLFGTGLMYEMVNYSN